MFEDLTILDGILALVIAVGLLLGYKRGFFGSITKPIKILAAYCLTVLISAPILNAWTRPLFTGYVENWVYNSLLEACPEATGETAAEAMPTVLKLLAEFFKVDLSGLDSAATTEDILATIAEQISTPVGNFIAVVVTYVVLFIALILILSLLVALLDAVFTTGFLGKINKFLGLLLGGAVAAVVACIIANIVCHFTGNDGGFVVQFFKNLNPFSVVMRL